MYAKSCAAPMPGGRGPAAPALHHPRMAASASEVMCHRVLGVLPKLLMQRMSASDTGATARLSCAGAQAV